MTDCTTPPRAALLMVTLAVLVAGCDAAAPTDRVDITGTYDGNINSARFDADVRLVARETANGTVTGTFALDTGGRAIPYTVAGRHVGRDLALTFTADTGLRIDYDGEATAGPDGVVRLTGTVCSRGLWLDCTMLILAP